jgi:putative ABC transport system permease protein
MAKELKLAEPIGAIITDPWNNKWTVVGLIDDFHWESLRSTIKPLALVHGKTNSLMMLKVNTDEMQNTLSEITKVWKQVSPSQSIRYSFLDQSYLRMYEDVVRSKTMFVGLSCLAVIVACLGLFALSTFMIEQRGKEVSIRIVLGASIKSIVRLLTQDFVMLVVISFLIAVPLSWYLMQQWLEDYAYKITLSWSIFLTAGLASLAIALLTVSYQSIRAALVNPARILKNE